MPSFTGAEFNRCRVQRVPNFVGAEFNQRIPSLTDALFTGCRVVQHSYPIGHPEVITQNFGDINSYFGLIHCRISPPRGLYPVLPYRTGGKLLFPLCRTCTENNENDQHPCTHQDSERSLTGTWLTSEVQKYRKPWN